MLNLKKMIRRYMQIITLIMVGVILVSVFIFQMLNEQRRERENATRMFSQMELILADNQRELAALENEYRQTCLNNAEAIAYIIQYQPWVLEDVEELRKIAAIIEVDEIHIFDDTGRIFTGTHPEYYGYTFDSGEQIGFFKPMLEEKTLRLCQDITPNTAEGKLMQYSALWSENGEFIVQVGMEPINVMRVTEKNELSYIFSLLRVSVGASFYAIDAESGEIVGATVLNDLGKNLTEIGFDFDEVKSDEDGFHANINGVGSYCVFKLVGTNYIGRVVSNDVIYQRIPISVAVLLASLVIVAIILVHAVTWYMNKYVINGIYGVNEKLRAITRGNLDESVDIQSSREFSELSDHINEMVKSLLADMDKISYVLNKTNVRVGVYEYSEYMKHVRFTEYIPEILKLDDNKARQLATDYKLFKAYMDTLRNNSAADEAGVFCLEGSSKTYVKIEELNQDSEVFGIVIDVTEEIVKRRQLEAERDVDALTGLYNRRGLENKLELLFKRAEKLGYGALIMIDADGLKEINDKYGHEKGDIYLKKIAGVINSFGINSCIAARQGGDEFVMFLYHYDSEEELIRTIKTLEYIQHNSSAHLSDDLSVPLRFSMGYSLTKGQTDYLTLLKQADDRMYFNKRERKQVLDSQGQK